MRRQLEASREAADLQAIAEDDSSRDSCAPSASQEAASAAAAADAADAACAVLPGAPPNLYVKRGADLRRASEQYIVQQCNCIATRPHGLSETLEAAFPGSCPYTARRCVPGRRNRAIKDDRGAPGTIAVLGARRVIAMFVQVSYGRPSQYWQDGAPDTAAARLRYFKACLVQVARLRPVSLALPFFIGCGLAGGDWAQYYGVLCEFAAALPRTRIVLYDVRPAPAARQLPSAAIESSTSADVDCGSAARTRAACIHGEGASTADAHACARSPICSTIHDPSDVGGAGVGYTTASGSASLAMHAVGGASTNATTTAAAPPSAAPSTSSPTASARRVSNVQCRRDACA